MNGMSWDRFSRMDLRIRCIFYKVTRSAYKSRTGVKVQYGLAKSLSLSFFRLKRCSLFWLNILEVYILSINTVIM